MQDDLKRVVVWKNLVLNGTDYCALWHTPEGWLLKGTVLGVLEDRRPILATYEVHCDEQWHTHRVQVERTIGGDFEIPQPHSGEPRNMAQFRAGVARTARLRGC